MHGNIAKKYVKGVKAHVWGKRRKNFLSLGTRVNDCIVKNMGNYEETYVKPV